MSVQEKLCMSCMRPVPLDVTACPHCGYNGTQQNPAGIMPIGTRLKGGRYVIGMRTEMDGNSVTNIAYDCKLNTMVYVREFLLKDKCSRAKGELALQSNVGDELLYKTELMDFCELYRSLSRISNDIPLIRVTDFFEANGTAYAVMERFGGIPLRELLSRAGGTISFDQAYALLQPVGEALNEMHDVSLLHRGISPNTIFVNHKGDVRLGGYGTASVRTKGSEIPSRLQSGYSAPEQYSVMMWQSAATDVYSLAAVMYRCITGTTPPDGEQRRGYDSLETAATLNGEIQPRVSRAISRAMTVNSKERTSSVQEFMQGFFEPISDQTRRAVAMATGQEIPEDLVFNTSSDIPVQPAKEPEPKSVIHRQEPTLVRVPEPDDEDGNEKRKFPWIGALLILIAVVSVVIVMRYVGLKVLDEFKNNDTPPVAAVSTVEVPDYLNQDVSEIHMDNDTYSYKIEKVVDADTEAGTILSQKPAAGSKIDNSDGEKIEITLTISTGKRVVLDNYVGSQIDEVEQVLYYKGVEYSIFEVEDDTHISGTVIEQSPEAGKTIDPSSQVVSLTVAVAVPVVEPEEPAVPDGTNPDDGTNPHENNGNGNGNNG